MRRPTNDPRTTAGRPRRPAGPTRRAMPPTTRGPSAPAAATLGRRPGRSSPRTPPFDPRRSDLPSLDAEIVSAAQAYLEMRRLRTAPIPEAYRRAWEHFYGVCGPLIERAVGAYRLPEQDRRDCAQEVWKEIVAELGRFVYDPQRGQLLTWVSTLARNKAVDAVRRRAKHPELPLGDTAQASLVARDGDPEGSYRHSCARAWVREALDELARKVSPRSFRVLKLRWFEGRTTREIAEALGLTPDQVRFRHHRLLRKLLRMGQMARAWVACEGD